MGQVQRKEKILSKYSYELTHQLSNGSLCEWTKQFHKLDFCSFPPHRVINLQSYHIQKDNFDTVELLNNHLKQLELMLPKRDMKDCYSFEKVRVGFSTIHPDMLGLFSIKDLEPNEFIGNYTGELVSREVVKQNKISGRYTCEIDSFYQEGVDSDQNVWFDDKSDADLETVGTKDFNDLFGNVDQDDGLSLFGSDLDYDEFDAIRVDENVRKSSRIASNLLFKKSVDDALNKKYSFKFAIDASDPFSCFGRYGNCPPVGKQNNSYIYTVEHTPETRITALELRVGHKKIMSGKKFLLIMVKLTGWLILPCDQLEIQSKNCFWLLPRMKLILNSHMCLNNKKSYLCLMMTMMKIMLKR